MTNEIDAPCAPCFADSKVKSVVKPARVELVPEVLVREAQMIQDRRQIHMFPELAYTETQTAALIAARLRELGIEVFEGVGITGFEYGEIDPFLTTFLSCSRCRWLASRESTGPLCCTKSGHGRFTITRGVSVEDLFTATFAALMEIEITH